MTIFEASLAVQPVVDAWAQWFVEGPRRTQGSLTGDFDRFLAAYRVPSDVHEAVRERVQELLLDTAVRAARAASSPS